MRRSREFVERSLNRVCASAALIGIGAGTGCSTFEGLHRADPDASSHEECQSAQPPRPAESPDMGSGPEFWLVVKWVDIGDGDQDGVPLYSQVGYDLDQACTGQGDGPSCIKPSWATADHSDGPGGRDNALGALHDANGYGFGSWTVTFTAIARAGFMSSIIRVRGYNQMGADNQVEVSWYGGRLHAPSAFEDEWAVFDRWLEPVSAGAAGASDDAYPPRYHDPLAYVTTDNVLVAHFREALTVTGLFQHVVLTGKLVRNLVWELRDATFAARLNLDEALGLLSRFTVMGEQVCTNAPDYEALKANLCSYADIHSAAPYDPFTPDDPSLPCDALSAAWAFGADPVNVVGVDNWEAFWESVYSPCPAGTSPADDSCGTLGN